jgi:hypothetical protein
MLKYTYNGTETTATITDCRYDAIKLIYKRHAGLKSSYLRAEDVIEDMKEGIDTFRLKTALMPDTMSATARLEKGDRYDPEMGRQVAHKKLEVRLHRCIDKAVKRWVEEEHKRLDKIMFDSKYDKAVKEYEELIIEVERL